MKYVKSCFILGLTSISLNVSADSFTYTENFASYSLEINFSGTNEGNYADQITVTGITFDNNSLNPAQFLLWNPNGSATFSSAPYLNNWELASSVMTNPGISYDSYGNINPLTSFTFLSLPTQPTTLSPNTSWQWFDITTNFYSEILGPIGANNPPVIQWINDNSHDVNQNLIAMQTSSYVGPPNGVYVGSNNNTLNSIILVDNTTGLSVPASVPLPNSLLLFLSGLIGLIRLRKR